MFKRLFAIFILLFCTQQVFAKEIAIQITPAHVYKTSNNGIKEGDFIEFVTVDDVANFKKGTTVIGLVTEVVENGFGGRVATVYIEQFKLNKNKNLKGIVYQKGNTHPIFFEYFGNVDDSSLGFSPIRGGEAFLRPHKDIFTLYLEVKEWKNFY